MPGRVGLLVPLLAGPSVHLHSNTVQCDQDMSNLVGVGGGAFHIII